MSKLDPSLFPDLAETPIQRRSATTNNPMRARAKQSTAEGRRLADLYRGVLRAIGGNPSGVQQANALACAELSLACENERAKLLRGDGDANAVVRLENARDRALRKLGLADPPDPEESKPTLKEYLERRNNTSEGAA
jgi:hypothetical protein